MFIGRRRGSHANQAAPRSTTVVIKSTWNIASNTTVERDPVPSSSNRTTFMKVSLGVAKYYTSSLGFEYET